MATDTYYTPEASRWKWEFSYDGQSRMRIRKDYVWMGSGWYPNGETRYLYEGMLVLQERSSANSPTVTYTRGRDLSGSLEGAGGIGGLLARSHGYSAGTWSTHNFYHADGNGNVGALVNSAGALQASYKYDPYGRYLGGSGTVAAANQMRWSSKLWVGFGGSNTDDLYYYGYRFYDPYLQRWVNRDPIGESGGINLSVFVANDPVYHLDTLGLEKDRDCIRECTSEFLIDCPNGRGTTTSLLFGGGAYVLDEGITTPKTKRIRMLCRAGGLTKFGRAALIGGIVGGAELAFDNLPCLSGYLLCIEGCPDEKKWCVIGPTGVSVYPTPLPVQGCVYNAPPQIVIILPH